jgi:hypothetical protein
MLTHQGFMRPATLKGLSVADIPIIAFACDFSLELWSLRVLAIPEIGNSAAQAAAQADFVIISTHGKAELAPATRNWIGRWSRLIGDDVPALVVLVDQTETSGGKMTSTLRYLRNITDRKGISLYPHNNCLAV